MNQEIVGNEELTNAKNYIRRNFNSGLIERDQTGTIQKINLPNDNDPQTSYKFFRSLNTLNIKLTITDVGEKSIKVAVVDPIAISQLLEITSPELSGEVVVPDTYTTDWLPEDFEEPIDDTEKVDGDLDDKELEVDVYDQIKESAKEFYSGVSEENSITPDIEYSRYATDKKLFRQRFVWKDRELYNKETDQIISADEHLQIIERAKDDPASLALAMQIHEGLVRHIANKLAKKYTLNHRFSMDDLLQEGRIALMEAIPKINDHAKYLSYLEICISGQMVRALKTRRPLELKANVGGELKKIIKAKRKFKSQNIIPTIGNFAEELEVDEKRARDLLFVLHQETLEFNDEDSEMYRNENIGPEEFSDIYLGMDSADPDTKINIEEMRNIVSDKLNSLDPRQDMALRLRFGILGNSARWKNGDLINHAFGFSAKFVKALKNKITRQETLLKHEIVLAIILGYLDESRADKIISGNDSACCTLEETAQILGVTRERARGIEMKALREMKHPRIYKTLKPLMPG